MRHPMMPNAQENAYRLAAVVKTTALVNASNLSITVCDLTGKKSVKSTH